MTTVLLAIAAATAPTPVATGAEVVLAGREIRVRDVAALVRIEPSEERRIADRVIARLPAGRTSVTLSRGAITALARRVGARFAATDEAEGSIRFTMSVEPAAGRTCRTLLRAVPAGAIVAASNSDEAACDGGRSPAPVRYDREAGVVRASIALSEGAFLGDILLPEPPRVAQGDALAIISRVGPIEVRRSVTAIQALRHGTRVFVRSEDGTIFDVPAPQPSASEPREG
jgi:hypothetical protein